MTARGIGGGHKQKLRLVDFKRNKHGVEATVASRAFQRELAFRAIGVDGGVPLPVGQVEHMGGDGGVGALARVRRFVDVRPARCGQSQQQRLEAHAVGRRDDLEAVLAPVAKPVGDERPNFSQHGRAVWGRLGGHGRPARLPKAMIRVVS